MGFSVLVQECHMCNTEGIPQPVCSCRPHCRTGLEILVIWHLQDTPSTCIPKMVNLAQVFRGQKLRTNKHTNIQTHTHTQPNTQTKKHPEHVQIMPIYGLHLVQHSYQSFLTRRTTNRQTNTHAESNIASADERNKQNFFLHIITDKNVFNQSLPNFYRTIDMCKSLFPVNFSSLAPIVQELQKKMQIKTLTADISKF